METIIYVLKNGAPNWQEEILMTVKGKQTPNIDAINKAMAPRGYHFHRVSYYTQGARPDFVGTINK